MLHPTLSWIIALRVLFCPILCAGQAAARPSHPMASQQAVGCSCGCHNRAKIVGSDSASASSTSRKEGDPRTPLSDPCCSDCFCHTLVGSSGKLFPPAQHHWQAYSAMLPKIDTASTSYVVQFTKISERLDIPSGLAIRLALASLLI